MKMIAENIMRRDVVTIRKNATVNEAIRMMFEKHVGCLVVENNGHPEGLITRGDILEKVIAEGDDPEKMRIREIISDPPIVISPGWDVDSILKFMDETNLRRFPVVKGERLVGFISSSDVLRAKLGEG